MKELLLTNEQAKELIQLFKKIAKAHNATLTNNSKRSIDIVGMNQTRFILDYIYSDSNKVFNFREYFHNYALFRINLNNKFHKNADGTKIFGNRINHFSAEEYYLKADETTHYRAYPLPYGNISNSNDFLKILREVFEYAHVTNPELASIKIQEDLL